MLPRMLIVLTICTVCETALADDLDDPPAMDKDPRCLAEKAALEAKLKSVSDAPVLDGKPCPPDPEEIRRRESACRSAAYGSRVWKLIVDGLAVDSSMLSQGVPYVVETLGDPIREDVDDGFWDIDIYEIPRTLHFPGVTVKTRDFVSDAVDFDLTTGTVKPTDRIYEMSVESGEFQFAHGLSLGASREDIEAALGLPCAAVARFGRTAVRRKTKYSYYDWSDDERSRYSVTFYFFGARTIKSVRWYYDSVWH